MGLRLIFQIENWVTWMIREHTTFENAEIRADREPKKNVNWPEWATQRSVLPLEDQVVKEDESECQSYISHESQFHLVHTHVIEWTPLTTGVLQLWTHQRSVDRAESVWISELD
jgi:hypothetical protein